MKDRLILLFLPLVGIGYFLGALWLGGGELWLALTGDRAQGRIAGVLKVRSDHAEYVGRIAHRLEFEFANSSIVSVDVADYEPQAISLDSDPFPLSAIERSASDPRLPIGFPALLREATVGDAATLRRIIQRQSRLDRPNRIVRILKSESAVVWRRLPASTRTFELEDTLHAVPAGLTGSSSVTVVTRAEFGEPPASSDARGDRMISFMRTIGGQVVEPHRRDFILFDEPYETAQLPVFIFEAHGKHHALLSDLGRHGPPTVAFPVFGNCTVAYDPAAPAQALLMPHVAAPDGSMPVLDWFSTTCESLFSRWGYVAILAFGVVLCLAGSLLSFSLARSQSASRRETAE